MMITLPSILHKILHILSVYFSHFVGRTKIVFSFDLIPIVASFADAAPVTFQIPHIQALQVTYPLHLNLASVNESVRRNKCRKSSKRAATFSSLLTAFQIVHVLPLVKWALHI